MVSHNSEKVHILIEDERNIRGSNLRLWLDHKMMLHDVRTIVISITAKTELEIKSPRLGCLKSMRMEPLISRGKHFYGS